MQVIDTIRQRRQPGRLFAALLLLLTPFAVARSQDVSLSTDDTIDQIAVTLHGKPASFTVIQDARNPRQWYYVPDRPRLYEKTVGGNLEPEFSLIRYQFPDPSNEQLLIEKGLLQFAANLALPAEAVEQLRTVISQKKGLPKELINLAALRIKSAEVSIYTPPSDASDPGRLLAGAPHGNGVAPLFATQNMTFSVPLSKIGSAVYDALVNSNTGVPVTVVFTYTGLTPPAGFKVHVDWAQTVRHYSENTRFRAEASYFGLWGASYERQSQKIMEDLVNSKSIEIEIIEGSNFKISDAEKYLQPIVKRINDELLEQMKPPEKIDPAVTNAQSKGGFFGSVNYSAAVKQVAINKSGKETIDFRVRQYEERKTVASGFIGIGQYPETLRKKLVVDVTRDPFSSAFFALPAVGDDARLGIAQVDLEVALKRGNDKIATQLVTWRPREGWKDRLGAARTVVTFGLPALDQAGRSELKFETKSKITANNDVIEQTQTVDVFNGPTALTTPLAAVDVVEIDASDLTWRRVDQSSKLDRVLVTLKSGGRVMNVALRPRQGSDGKYLPPEPIYWIIKKNGGQPEPVNVTITYELNDGTNVKSRRNGDLTNLSLSLKDPDWQAAS